MTVSTLPAGGLTLRGIPPGIDDSKQSTASAILLKLSEDVIRDFKKASGTQGGLHFLAGNTPVRKSSGVVHIVCAVLR